MTHASITPSDDQHYYAGDSIDIPFAFTDQHGDTAIDLTGMAVEFRLKEALTDPDTDAVLEKSSEETDANSNAEIELTDATNGECLVHILTDDTADVVMQDTTRVESAVLSWHIRVIDSDGNRVTSETGEWEIWAS